MVRPRAFAVVMSEPLESADELLIKHRQLGIHDYGLGAQHRYGLR